MVALAMTNAVGIVLFGILYAVAGAGWLPQSAFLACLVILFGLVTALWIGVEERQGHGRGAVARLGKEAGVPTPTHHFITTVLTPFVQGQR